MGKMKDQMLNYETREEIDSAVAIKEEDLDEYFGEETTLTDSEIDGIRSQLFAQEMTKISDELEQILYRVKYHDDKFEYDTLLALHQEMQKAIENFS